MIDRAILEAEAKDYTKQLNEARNQAMIWQTKTNVADGALQAINALLAQLGPKDTGTTTTEGSGP